jgi:hypothetical protein
VKLKSLSAAAALVAAMFSGAAFANSYALPTNGVAVTASVSGLTFSDTFGFTLASGETFVGGAGSSAFNVHIVIPTYNVDLNIPVSPVTFTSLSLERLVSGSAYSSVLGTTTLPFNNGSASGISFAAGAPLLAGTYRFDVAGTTTSGAGSYAVAVSLAPVPEPETYAMMLAGLGLMGFIARRRKQS